LNVKDGADVNFNRDKHKILRYVYRIDNSLADKRPDVAAKWNFKRNDYLKPEMFSVSSNEIVWWTCPECGNEWQCSINSMTRKGRLGCLECSKKIRGKTFTKGIVAKIGSLAENMPELAKEWHPEKNGTLTPNDISAGRFKPVWWLCSKCGYEWQASPNNRKKGVGCPCCYGRVPQIGVNDLKTTHPDIANEWNYEKNGELRPNMVKPGSGRKVWWRCQVCGNEYLDIIRKRTSRKNKNSCPNCKSKN
ncbi:MAG: zinc-ribbon domain-containing protein, partial [Lentisphaeria bacterium]|nr:zinc-ribbon domain-containing protein [Lentisphaeria bacterium]